MVIYYAPTFYHKLFNNNVNNENNNTNINIAKKKEEEEEEKAKIEAKTNEVASELAYNEELTVLEKLNILNTYNNKFASIIDNYDEYPTTLLEMLLRDLDLFDFVIDYPEKFKTTYNGELDDVSDIPLLLQWDKRWGYQEYGDSSIAIDGCGPTALSMVVAGLTKDKKMTPAYVSAFAEEYNYFVPGVGTSWNLMSDGALQLGVKSRVLTLSKEEVFRALENGHPIICSMKKGDFTTTGHFIVLVGLEDGMIKVNDSNSKKRSSKLWSYEVLEGQIKNLWEFYK